MLNICHTFSNHHTQWQLGIWGMVVQSSTALTLLHLLLKQRSECPSHGDNVRDGASMDFAFLIYFPPKHLKKGWIKLWQASRFGNWLLAAAEEDRNVACQKSLSKFYSRAGDGNILECSPLLHRALSSSCQRLYKSFKHRNKLGWSPMVQNTQVWVQDLCCKTQLLNWLITSNRDSHSKENLKKNIVKNHLFLSPPATFGGIFLQNLWHFQGNFHEWGVWNEAAHGINGPSMAGHGLEVDWCSRSSDCLIFWQWRESRLTFQHSIAWENLERGDCWEKALCWGNVDVKLVLSVNLCADDPTIFSCTAGATHVVKRINLLFLAYKLLS